MTALAYHLRAADYPPHTRIADLARSLAAQGYALRPGRRGQLLAVRERRA